MPSPCQRLWGGSRGASEKVAARPTCGAVRRDCWEKSFSFVHSAYLAVTMGVHDHCRGEGGGATKKSFSVVLLADPTVAMIKMPSMFLSIPFRGIPTMVVLLPPVVPMTIHPN